MPEDKKPPPSLALLLQFLRDPRGRTPPDHLQRIARSLLEGPRDTEDMAEFVLAAVEAYAVYVLEKRERYLAGNPCFPAHMLDRAAEALEVIEGIFPPEFN